MTPTSRTLNVMAVELGKKKDQRKVEKDNNPYSFANFDFLS